ncbi:MAG: T9SS type A sorting domain-containing protein [Bacteroidota bacterium]|nr:T9SS type A sorting domain-containing protein [Bacteroidota bacterium]
MRQIKLAALLFGALAIYSNGYSQIIDYSYETLSTCNIFSAAKTIDGYSHLTTLSRPAYDDNSVVLKCQSSSSTKVRATIYSIAYPFKIGYKYKINVYAKGTTNQNQPQPNYGLKISGSNGGTDAGTDCVGPSEYNLSDASTFYQATTSSSYTFTVSNIFEAVVTQAATHLLVGAFPSLPTTATTTNGNVYIRKIEILETPPFTITPASTSIMCGSSAPVVFTANNNNGLSGITGYTWNLGSSSNGWLYNGSPASQTISTGTTNTLTLTPVCGATQSNISATVAAGGNNYTTNTSTVSIAQPTFSINGSSNLCSDFEIYSVNNLPCNSTVSWSASPSGIVSISVTNNQATVTKITGGDITLTAAISNSNACGSNSANLSTPVKVGYDYGAPYEIYGFEENQEFCGPETVTLSVDPFYDSYTWHIYGNATILSGQSTDYISLEIGSTSSTSSLYIEVVVTSCGQQYVIGTHGTIANCYYGLNNAYTISPNPASDIVTIDGIKNNKKIKEVQVIDKLGSVKRIRKYAENLQRVQFNVSGLKPDIYYIKIYDGEKWESKQIRVQ